MKRVLILILITALLLPCIGCGKAPDDFSNLDISGKYHLHAQRNEAIIDDFGTIDTIVDGNARIYYHIFVGSFSDSNGDGIGDLRGIINRFDYINDGNLLSETSLGVQGIWLSPIFSSPSYHKYDASDYYEVDWRFGAEEDLRELIALCKERNVKLILDLAINHTSSQHPWFLEFKEARKNGDTENPYYDYYSCATTEGKLNGVTYQKIAGVDCWYECNFSGSMPELNFDNPEVRQATLDIAKYYLELGVDGFRFDAVKYIYYGDTPQSVDFWVPFSCLFRLPSEGFPGNPLHI